ncbi:hypothetical protein RYX36_012750 [Vicia faba]
MKISGSISSIFHLCLLLLILIGTLSPSHAVDDKCAACKAVAEKPRNHLDMRHRLDSKGQRQGKLIDYRISELRVVDLLDGLCDKMQDYTLRIFPDFHEWYKVGNWDNLKTNKQEAKAYSKDISSYCGSYYIYVHLHYMV